MIAKPIRPPDVAKCNSVKCTAFAVHKLNNLIQNAANACNCGPCKKPVYLDLFSFCQAYVNYDPKLQGLIQCIINRLSNPCYKEYYEFQNIMNTFCGKVGQKKNFNIYTFLSDVCNGCNGCLEGCWVQSGSRIYYSQPEPYTKDLKCSKRPADTSDESDKSEESESSESSESSKSEFKCH